MAMAEKHHVLPLLGGSPTAASAAAATAAGVSYTTIPAAFAAATSAGTAKPLEQLTPRSPACKRDCDDHAGLSTPSTPKSPSLSISDLNAKPYPLPPRPPKNVSPPAPSLLSSIWSGMTLVAGNAAEMAVEAIMGISSEEFLTAAAATDLATAAFTSAAAAGGSEESDDHASSASFAFGRSSPLSIGQTPRRSRRLGGNDVSRSTGGDVASPEKAVRDYLRSCSDTPRSSTSPGGSCQGAGGSHGSSYIRSYSCGNMPGTNNGAGTTTPVGGNLSPRGDRGISSISPRYDRSSSSSGNGGGLSPRFNGSSSAARGVGSQGGSPASPFGEILHTSGFNWAALAGKSPRGSRTSRSRTTSSAGGGSSSAPRPSSAAAAAAIGGCATAAASGSAAGALGGVVFGGFGDEGNTGSNFSWQLSGVQPAGFQFKSTGLAGEEGGRASSSSRAASARRSPRTSQCSRAAAGDGLGAIEAGVSFKSSSGCSSNKDSSSSSSTQFAPAESLRADRGSFLADGSADMPRSSSPCLGVIEDSSRGTAAGSTGGWLMLGKRPPGLLSHHSSVAGLVVESVGVEFPAVSGPDSPHPPTPRLNASGVSFDGSIRASSSSGGDGSGMWLGCGSGGDGGEKGGSRGVSGSKVGHGSDNTGFISSALDLMDDVDLVDSRLDEPGGGRFAGDEHDAAAAADSEAGVSSSSSGGFVQSFALPLLNLVGLMTPRGTSSSKPYTGASPRGAAGALSPRGAAAAVGKVRDGGGYPMPQMLADGVQL